jgi:hypothetical protein
MAREAGCIPVRHPEYDNDVQVFATPDVLKAFEALVRADAIADEREEFQRWFDAVTAQHKQEILAEREACAKLAQSTVCDTHIPTGVKIYGTAAAKAILARGETK